MPKLPSIHLVEAPAWQRDRLRSWIEEWTLDLALRGALGEPANDLLAPVKTMFPDPALDLVRPYDEQVEVHQIRLLGPTVAPDSDRPICVAILGDTPDKLFLTAPFSRFGIPATPGEWLTGRDTRALRVLSIWNTRLFDSNYLRESWLIGELTEAESAAAWEVFGFQMAAQPLPSTLASQVGPPVVHPRDPRLRYQAEEAALFAAIGAAVETVSRNILTEFVSLRTIRESIAEQELDLAADTGDTGGAPFAREIFEVPAYSVFVRAYLASDAEHIVFVVHDSGGDPSEALDGTNIVAEDGRILASIQKGGASIPLSTPLPEVGLRLASGESLLWRKSTGS